MTPILVCGLVRRLERWTQETEFPNAAIALKRIKPPTVVLSMNRRARELYNLARRQAVTEANLNSSSKSPTIEGRHKVCHGAGNHRAGSRVWRAGHALFGAKGRQMPTDLNADGAEVGKAAERKKWRW